MTAPTLPIRSDLAADLRQWLADKAAPRQEAARNAPTVWIDSEDVEPRKRATVRLRGRQGQSCQQVTTLPPGELLFVVPSGLVRILDRDLQAAGIAKRDDRGRTIDVPALRHSFGTLLSKGGVLPRTAQAAMRLSSIDLTMNTYTDPRLLDVHAAVDALPELPLDGTERHRQVLTGTDGTYGTYGTNANAEFNDRFRHAFGIPRKRVVGDQHVNGSNCIIRVSPSGLTSPRKETEEHERVS